MPPPRLSVNFLRSTYAEDPARTLANGLICLRCYLPFGIALAAGLMYEGGVELDVRHRAINKSLFCSKSQRCVYLSRACIHRPPCATPGSFNRRDVSSQSHGFCNNQHHYFDCKSRELNTEYRRENKYSDATTGSCTTEWKLGLRKLVLTSCRGFA